MEHVERAEQKWKYTVTGGDVSSERILEIQAGITRALEVAHKLHTIPTMTALLESYGVRIEYSEDKSASNGDLNTGEANGAK